MDQLTVNSFYLLLILSPSASTLHHHLHLVLSSTALQKGNTKQKNVIRSVHNAIVSYVALLAGASLVLHLLFFIILFALHSCIICILHFITIVIGRLALVMWLFCCHRPLGSAIAVPSLPMNTSLFSVRLFLWLMVFIHRIDGIPYTTLSSLLLCDYNDHHRLINRLRFASITITLG